MLGRRIKKYLQENGIKQSFLAEKTGLTDNQISDICSGAKKSIDTIVYYKICKALNVDLLFFLTDGKETEL